MKQVVIEEKVDSDAQVKLLEAGAEGQPLILGEDSAALAGLNDCFLRKSMHTLRWTIS